MLWVAHDEVILLSTPFPTIPMLGNNCCCDVMVFYIGNRRCCVVLCCVVLYCIVLYCIELEPYSRIDNVVISGLHVSAGSYAQAVGGADEEGG